MLLAVAALLFVTLVIDTDATA